MQTTYTAEQTKFLASLDDEGIEALLGHILDAGQSSPIIMSDDLHDRLFNVREAFEAGYPFICEADPDQAFWNRADYEYEQRRDAA